MLLELHRKIFTQFSTIGELYVDGGWECFTLEDPVRDLKEDGSGKIWGDTAIPAGSYEVVVNVSPRFQRLLPRLLDVPYFNGILIHKGNVPGNTHGCILIGKGHGEDNVNRSTQAFDDLFPQLLDAQNAHDKILITITNDGEPYAFI